MLLSKHLAWVLHCFLPSDQRANETSESNAEAILAGICQLSTKQLGFLVGTCRVYLQQQCSFVD